MKTRMRVLIACECSGAVREAFRRRGHEAWSCDLKPAEDGSAFHIQGDATEAILNGPPVRFRADIKKPRKWDLIIMHPPCTFLSVSGIHWNDRGRGWAKTNTALAFVLAMIEAAGGVPYALENPIGILSTRWREPDQIIQPWQFGEDASKATCLWLRGVRPLLATHRDNDFFLRPVDAGRRTPDAGRKEAFRKSDGFRPEQTGAKRGPGNGTGSNLLQDSRGNG